MGCGSSKSTPAAVPVQATPAASEAVVTTNAPGSAKGAQLQDEPKMVSPDAASHAAPPNDQSQPEGVNEACPANLNVSPTKTCTDYESADALEVVKSNGQLIPRLEPEQNHQALTPTETADVLAGVKLGAENSVAAPAEAYAPQAESIKEGFQQILEQSSNPSHFTVLHQQPANPAGSIFVLECQGGSDKGPDGHRRDTLPICNALIEKGWSAEPIFYSDGEYEATKAKLEDCQGVIVRIRPGGYEGVTQTKIDDLLRGLADKGVRVMSHPDVMTGMGSKDSLVKIRGSLSCGLPDTYAYYDISSFQESFPKTIATGPRVLKQNHGSQGEGIWVCRLKDASEADNVTGSTVLELQEAFDNHPEEKTLDEFMTLCEQYLDGDNAQLIDQQFLPRIEEGEIRVTMVYTTPVEVVVRKPAEGGISATLASGATYEPFKPEDVRFAPLLETFVDKDMPRLMDALGLEGHPLPLIWTADFILGPKDESGNDTYCAGQFGCACVGITRQQLHLTADVAEAAMKICG